VTSAPTARAWGGFDRLLALAACAAGLLIALRAPGVGDYPNDAGPALSAIAHGSIGSFFAHQPAMGAVSLYLRAPFVILAAAFHDSPVGLYRWGDVPCVLSVAVVAIWMSRVAASRGTARAGQALIVAVCLLGPLVHDALYWGHPEELLTASLAVAALLAACERRVVLAAVLTGLAVASKQWAVVIVLPVLLVVERERIRAALVMLAVSAGATLPLVVGNFASFRHVLHFLSSAQHVTTVFTWLYPFSPPGIVHLTGLYAGDRSFYAHTVPTVVGAISHPLIIGLGILLPLLVWQRGGRHLSVGALLSVAALVFLLRCVLDPETAGYYHLPLLLTLVALDATAGRRLPVAGLVGAAGAFAVLERFPNYLGEGAVNLLYILATVLAAALLVRELRRCARPVGSATVSPSAWRSPGASEQAA
jgi:hypothetical protein